MKRPARLRSTIVSLASAGCAVMLLGCSSEPSNLRTTPGLNAEERARLPKAAPPAAEEEEKAAPVAEPFAQRREDPFNSERPGDMAPGALMAPGSAGTGGANAGATTGAPAEKEKERDLGEELKVALGQPTECLDLNKVVEGGGKISVHVGAYVGPSGRITRATVSAPGQPSSAATCIEQRAVAIKMREPIDDAPRLVQTDITLEIARAPAPKAAEPAPPPPPPSY